MCHGDCQGAARAASFGARSRPMNTKPFALSVKAVVRDAGGRCLVLRRSMASKHHAGMWEFPGGKLDPGETFDVALLREIREETGLEAQLTRVAGAGESEMPERMIAYIFMEARAECAEVRLSDEHDSFQWIEPAWLATVDLCPQFREFAAAFAARAHS